MASDSALNPAQTSTVPDSGPKHADGTGAQSSKPAPGQNPPFRDPPSQGPSNQDPHQDPPQDPHQNPHLDPTSQDPSLQDPTSQEESGGGSVQDPAAPAPPIPLTTVGGHTVFRDPSDPTGVRIDGTHYTPGGSGATIDDMLISVVPIGFVIGASTIAWSSYPTLSHNSNSPGSGDPSANNLYRPFLIGSTKLSAGRPALTVSGHVYSAATNGLLLDGHIATSDPQPLVLGSATLSVGGPAMTTNGHTLSLAAGGIVIDGLTMTPASNALVFGTMTLSVGGPVVTSNGDVIGLATGGLVVNGDTLSLGSGTASTSVADVGCAVMRGLGESCPEDSGATVAAITTAETRIATGSEEPILFTGGQGKVRISRLLASFTGCAVLAKVLGL